MTYYNWHSKYGNLTASDAKRLKLLEKENERLKKLVADLSLDNASLKKLIQESSKLDKTTRDYTTCI